MPHFLYTNGVIAVKENTLLKDKILRFCEMTAEDAFRALLESGFGGGAEGYDLDSLAFREETLLDEFIAEYAPSEGERQYLLSKRDFHNAKACFKAEYLQIEDKNMLAPQGTLPIEQIRLGVKGEGVELPEQMQRAIARAKLLVEEGNVSGAKIGATFDQAYFSHLNGVCKRNSLLKKFVAQRADLTNILICMRSESYEFARECFVSGGKLSSSTLSALFEGEEGAKNAFQKTAYLSFLEQCLLAREGKQPYTVPERILDSFECDYFFEKRYELQKNQPFLYYVFRRRAEIFNVRMVFVCLNAGMKEGEIKRRLRAI